jgi:hypothetical protein
MMCPYLNNALSDYFEFEYYAFYYIIFSISVFNVFIFANFVTLKDYKIDLLINLFTLFLKNVFLSFSLIRIKLSKFVFFNIYKTHKNSHIYTFIKL